MPDPEIVAAMQYMQEQRNQQVIDHLVNDPPPIPHPTFADAIAARDWPKDTRPPLSQDELQAAIKILEGATGQPPSETLTMIVREEGGGASPGGVSGGQAGGGTGFGGIPMGGTGLGMPRSPIPDGKDVSTEVFLHWLTDPMSTPFNQPEVSLSAKEKLAAITAAMPQAKSAAHLKRLQSLQAIYYYQARNEAGQT